MRPARISRLLPSLLLAMVALPAAAGPPPDTIVLPDGIIVPESLTAARDGTIYIGSMAQGAIYRAAPGAAFAEAFIAPRTDGLRQVLGVLVDEMRGVLWVCSFSEEDGAAPSELLAFDLDSRRVRQRHPLPTPGAVCNDIALAQAGDVYVTDSANMEILRLGTAEAGLERWAGDGAFGPRGGVLDGIAVVDGAVLVNTLETGKLFRVGIAADGRAEPVVELALERPLAGPDGMRAFGGNALLLVESRPPGRLTRIDLDGPPGRVTTLREGFPDDPASVAVVGEYAYVLEAQWSALDRRPEDPPARPFKATAVHVGRP